MSALLAKSKPLEALVEHTENCLSVLASMREIMPFLGDISGEQDFFEHLFYAVALHDLGKGAVGFQQQLTDGARWGYRHEILSAGFANGLSMPQTAKQAIGLAILTHHKDIQVLGKEYPAHPPRNPGFSHWQSRVAELEDNWEELLQIQERVHSWFTRPDCSFHPVSSVDQLANGHRDFLCPYQFALDDEEYTTLHGRYGMLLRGCLIACDHLASAGGTEILRALDDMAGRLRWEIDHKEGRHFEQWQSFQESSSRIEGHLMLSAPTGSGKTEAALLWTQANAGESNGQRVFYVLPYVASINAMYQRLLKLVSDDRLGLLHGKASYFLYRYLADGEYAPEQAKIQVRQHQSLTRKLYRPYKVLTPFQLLKAFFGIRGFEMQFAEMAGGLFIFDEIHAYDPHTTALISTMVEHLCRDYAARFCIMTATMPEFLKRMFVETLGEVTEVEMSSTERDKFTRHRIRLLPGGISEAMPQIEERLNGGERVLVICNTVRQAQMVFEGLRNVAANAGLLHSRFILRDRERIESRLEDYDLLVGTQALEVSLDIDFDVLFSEPAPIDALIQRFGRVNRARRFPTADVCLCCEGGEHDSYIYPAARVQATLDALREVDILHESHIQQLIESVYGNGYNDKEQEKFDRARNAFSQYQKHIVPFVEDPSGRDEFTSLFKSVEVVPAIYESNFLERVEAKEFYEAMAYITSISEQQFARLHKEGQMYKQERQWFVKVGYDPERGLLLDEKGGNVL